MPLACRMLRGAECPPGRCSWDEGLVFISSRNGTSVLGQIRRFGGGSAKALRSGGWSRTKCVSDAVWEDLPR